mgnify:CR=1 FL=1
MFYTVKLARFDSDEKYWLHEDPNKYWWRAYVGGRRATDPDSDNDGLLFLPTFWTDAGVDRALRYVPGPIEGEGPWKVGNAIVTLLACHGTDAELANDFSCWQSRLLELGEAYPAKQDIERQMKLHAAAAAGLSDCHPRFRKWQP